MTKSPRPSLDLNLQLPDQPLSKGIRKLEPKSKKYYRISPRNKSKSKVVHFSDPEVVDPEPIRKSLISNSLRRIKLRTGWSNQGTGSGQPIATCTKLLLLPSPTLDLSDINGKVKPESNFETKLEETDMGNNASNQSRRHSALTPERHSHVTKSSTFGCHPNSKSQSAISKEDSRFPASASTNNILKPANHNRFPITNRQFSIYNSSNYEDVVNGNTFPVSPQTLQELNASREEKKQLRDRFFREESTVIPVPVPTSGPSPSKIPIPVTMSSIPRNANGFPKNPIVKEKRTFQYQPPSQQLTYSSSTSLVPKLYSTDNINRNINEDSSEVGILKSRSLITVASYPAPAQELSNLTSSQRYRFPGPSTSSYGNGSSNESWKPATEVFSTQSCLERDLDSRRTTAPPKIISQRRHNFGIPSKIPTIPVTAAEVGSSDESRRHTLFGWNSKIVPHSSGLQKPIPSKPFFMMGLYGSGKGPSPNGFQGVSTGVVNQRKLFYQSKMVEEKGGGAEPLKVTPLLRSSTWIKSQEDLPPPMGLEMNNSNVPKSFSTHSMGKSMDTNIPTLSASGFKSHGIATVPHETDLLNVDESELLHVSAHAEEIPADPPHHHKAESDAISITSKGSSNFPMRNDGSGTSTTSLNRSGRSGSREREHNVISDSEFLIEDEISDQPELT